MNEITIDERSLHGPITQYRIDPISGNYRKYINNQFIEEVSREFIVEFVLNNNESYYEKKNIK